MTDIDPTMSGLDAAISTSANLVAATGSPMFVAISSWLLALVFAWSGAAKLRRPNRAAFALVRFGLALRARTSYGLAVAVVELALATALVGRLPLGAWAAAALLWFFAALLLREVLAGRREPCFCFGSDASLSWISAGRTLLLAGLATRLALARPVRLDTGAEVLAAIVAAAVLAVVALGAALPALLNSTSSSNAASSQ